jgi:group I intron endonuclease
MEAVLKRSKSAIYSAILNLGISFFKLEILQYCSREECIKIEQKYINLLQPSYNILKIAGSSLGFQHSDESLCKMRKMGAQKSDETRAKMSASQIGNSNGKIQPNSIKIVVTDLELGGGSASPLKLLIILLMQQLKH